MGFGCLNTFDDLALWALCLSFVWGKFHLQEAGFDPFIFARILVALYIYILRPPSSGHLYTYLTLHPQAGNLIAVNGTIHV